MAAACGPSLGCVVVRADGIAWRGGPGGRSGLRARKGWSLAKGAFPEGRVLETITSCG
ncbi:MAG: hypothetical protein M0Q13_15925 [Methanothrix sp.]|nr:hypothetical protein [Methanothrix sp.]